MPKNTWKALLSKKKKGGMFPMGERDEIEKRALALLKNWRLVQHLVLNKQKDSLATAYYFSFKYFS